MAMHNKLLYKIKKSIRKRWMIIVGFILYKFYPKKTLVLLTGPMRSGTILLKVLLSVAPDVSCLLENNIKDIDLERLLLKDDKTKKMMKYLGYEH